MTDWRNLGGSSNKRGNRYEDNFAVYSIVKMARLHPHVAPGQVRLKEQVGCPVDDILRIEGALHSYAQLKSGQSVSWEARAGKLRLEFEQQAAECQQRQEAFTLELVVAHSALQQSLETSKPARIAAHTRVRHFPYCQRLAELRRLKPSIDDSLVELVATRFRSATELEHALLAFQSAWINHVPDPEGFCDLATMLKSIRGARLKQMAVPPPEWTKAALILQAIPNLELWFDRGFLEFRYPPTDEGLFPTPLDSPGFARFVSRVLESKPTSFEEFEVLWP